MKTFDRQARLALLFLLVLVLAIGAVFVVSLTTNFLPPWIFGVGLVFAFVAYGLAYAAIRVLRGRLERQLDEGSANQTRN